MKSARFIAVMLALAGCAAPNLSTRQAEPYSAGTRLVTLAPSLTEIAFAIGCSSDVVADTSYDDFPPQAARLPHVADLVHVDVERLAALRPTAVIALHDQEREGAQIDSKFDLPIAYLPNRRLDDLYADVSGVGRACRQTKAARALIGSMRTRIARAARRAARFGHRPTVLYLLGLPGFTVGESSYLNDLIKLAGGSNVAGAVDQPYPNLSAEAIAAADPDIIIVSRSVNFGPDVRGRPPWNALRAVRSGRVLRPPNDDILERLGPRVVDGFEWLVRVLHS